MISYFSSILYHSNTKGLPPSIRQNTRLKLPGLIFNSKLELKLTVYSQCLYFLCFIQCARSWVGISWIFDALNEASKETVYFLCCSTTYIPNQHKLTKYVCQNIMTLKLKGCEPCFFSNFKMNVMEIISSCSFPKQFFFEWLPIFQFIFLIDVIW